MDILYQQFYRIAYRLATISWAIFKPEIKGACVAIQCNGKILLVKNSYRDTYGLPGGMINRNEDADETAVRELREECGIDVDKSDLKLWHVYQGYKKNRNDKCHIYELEMANEPEIKIDNREVIEAKFFDKTEIAKLAVWGAVSLYLQEKSKSI